jgi:FAD/FMN-containing dehydrogenase/Fe-S oxidoreductase
VSRAVARPTRRDGYNGSMTTILELQRDTLARHLRKHLAGEIRFDAASRRLYSTDASIYQIEPLGVVIPRNTDDLAATMQVCAEMRVPIIARGGGTSLSGQSIGPGVVVDCSKYLNKILDLDPVTRTVRVQPGVVLDQLNRAAAVHDLQFGPDVSTSSRANLGGMIGNNSAGSRSIVYGKTIDHVRRLDVVLSNGQRAVFAPLPAAEWERRASGKSLEAELYRTVRDVVRQESDEIVRRYPRILRRVSGYNLDVFCPQFTGRTDDVGLHQLIVGSEGTLALIAEAELKLMPRPRVRGLLVPQFTTLAAALDALAACLEMKPSAVEVLDHFLLERAAENLALRDTMKAIPGHPGAVFMVEFSGDERAEVADRIERLQRRLAGVDGLLTIVPALDPALRDPLWDLRRAAMPILYAMPGDAKPVTFVEDVAVAPARLPEFIARFREILARHNTDGSFYGHASVGCLHIRPVLNLKKTEEVIRMRRITAEVTDLLLEYGGSLSGEHGDGLARSEWNEKMFGPRLYRAFQRVKAAFDPNQLLNPGKIVAAPPMTENLRYPPGYDPIEPPTIFDYSKQQGFLRSIEMCNGSGVCRKTQGGAMCPSYRATRDEADSTRGRANALRHALAEEGEKGRKGEGEISNRLLALSPLLPFSPSSGEAPSALRSKWVHEIFDLCLMCKACKAECPSNVDVAKLKAEFLQFYYRGRPRPLGHLLAANIHRFNRFAAPLAPLVNWLQTREVSRRLLESFAGVDQRRSLPLLQRRHFRRWFARHRPDANAGRHGKVLLLADCFTTYTEPHIGQAAVRVLERAGYAVELAKVACCGRPMISKGFLLETRSLIQRDAPALARRVADGTPLLGLEPSCLLTLADEWTELLPGKETRQVATACHLADGWLARQIHAGHCELPMMPRSEKCVLHGHCHQKALHGVAASAPALKLIPGLDVTVLDAGCCGMAGMFGYEREHYDLSVKIANLALLPALAAAPEATVVAPGTSCRHQIKDLAGRTALHPLEIVADAMRKT